MSKLDELIKEYCPDGVEYVELLEVANVLYGYPCDASFFNTDKIGFPLIRIRDVLEGVTDTYTTEKISSEYIIRSGDLLVGMDGNFHTGVWRFDDAYLCQRVCKIYSKNESIILNGFLAHLIKPIMKKIEQSKNSGTVKHLLAKDIKSIRLPVPPLEVQREIVRVLDKFTLLTAELTAELTARKKQYEYYRNDLLSFETKTERISLGDLFDFRNGLSKGKDFFGRGIPFIRYTDVYNNRYLRKDDITALVECTKDEIQKLNVKRGDVLFTRTSETAEDVGWSSVVLDDLDECVFNGFTIKATPKTDKLLPEYCSFCFSTDEFRKYVTKNCAFTTRASLTGETLSKYKLAVPSIEVQKKIADVLYNFEEICSNLNIGLPAEIEARQKQYEFYRDQLLTFVEKGETILTDRQTDRQTELN